MHEDDELDRILLGSIGSAAAALTGEFNRSRLTAGQHLSHYRIVEPIGEGGMGLVYKAEDEKLHRMVALKVLEPGSAIDGQLRSRLEHEARAASALDHPSICTVHDFDEHGDHRFIVMEYLTGQTLKDRAATEVPENEAIRIALAVASALEAAHQRHIVHCDIKPANIFLTHHGEIKVLDFGIAKLRSSDGGSRPASSNGAGTRGYMSPEQARGEDVDERTDIYSLGVVLRDIVRSPGAPLQRVIARMLHADRSGRFASMREVEAALRTVLTRSSRRPWLVTAAAMVLVAVVTAGAWFGLRPRPAALAERDWILVGSFDNRTSDSVFDDVLSDVAVQFAQSPYLMVFPETRIVEQLEQMRRPASQLLTADVAREICERAGIKAFVTGSIVSLGPRFVVRLDVLDARTGDYLAREQITAEDHTGVLRAIGRASSSIRRTLGESYQSIQRFDVPAETATTASLEALRAFRLGQNQMRLGTSAAMKAVPFFRRATELDPEFALAHARLGVAYANARETRRSEDAARRAFEHRARVSERERYEIETRYFDNVSGEVSKAVESVEMWAKTYPADPRPFNTLSTYLKNLGELERAAEAGEKALQLVPTSGVYRSNLAGAYFRLSDFARARAICEAAVRDGLDNSTTHRFLQQIGWITGDAALEAREQAWRRQRTSDYANVEYQAGVAGAQGRLREARALYREAVALTQREGLTDRAAEYRMRWAWLEWLMGNAREAVAITEPLLTSPVGRLLQADAALLLAAAGDRRYSGELERLARDYPADEYLNRLWQPLTGAVIDLRNGHHADAIEQLRLLDTYDRGDHALLRPSLFLGRARLAAGDAAAARRAFQYIIDNRGVVASSALYPIAHLELARAARRDGDPAAARVAYERVLALWQHADAELPALKSARREYARLAVPGAP
jgi:eukaryotic-like serine/threonine-protein kinase